MRLQQSKTALDTTTTTNEQGGAAGDGGWRALDGMSFDEQEAQLAPDGGPDKGKLGDGAKDPGDGKKGAGTGKKVDGWDPLHITDAQKEALVALFGAEGEDAVKAASKAAKGAGIPDNVLEAFLTRDLGWFKKCVKAAEKQSWFSIKFDPETGELKHYFEANDKKVAYERLTWGAVYDVSKTEGHLRIGKDGSDKEVVVGGGEKDGTITAYTTVGQTTSPNGQHTGSVALSDDNSKVTTEYGKKKVDERADDGGGKVVATTETSGTLVVDADKKKETIDGEDVTSSGVTLGGGYHDKYKVEQVEPGKDGKETRTELGSGSLDANATAGTTAGGVLVSGDFDKQQKTGLSEHQIGGSGSFETDSKNKIEGGKLTGETNTTETKLHFGKKDKDQAGLETKKDKKTGDETVVVTGPNRTQEVTADANLSTSDTENKDGSSAHATSGKITIAGKEDVKQLGDQEKHGRSGSVTVGGKTNSATDKDGATTESTESTLKLDRKEYSGDRANSESLGLGTKTNTGADGQTTSSGTISHTTVEQNGKDSKTVDKVFEYGADGSKYSATQTDVVGGETEKVKVTAGNNAAGTSLAYEQNVTHPDKSTSGGSVTVYDGDKDGFAADYHDKDATGSHTVSGSYTSTTDPAKNTTTNQGAATVGLTKNQVKTDDDGMTVTDAKTGQPVYEEVYSGKLTFTGKEVQGENGQSSSNVNVTFANTIQENTTANIKFDQEETTKDGSTVQVDKVGVDLGTAFDEKELSDGRVQKVTLTADGSVAMTKQDGGEGGLTWDGGVKVSVTKKPAGAGGTETTSGGGTTLDITLRGGKMKSSDLVPKFGFDKAQTPGILGANPSPYGSYGSLGVNYTDPAHKFSVGGNAMGGQTGNTSLLFGDFNMKLQKWSTQASASYYRTNDDWRVMVDATTEWTSKQGIRLGAGSKMTLDADQSQDLMWHYAKLGFAPQGSDGKDKYSIMLTGGALKEGAGPYVYPLGLDVSVSGVEAQAVTVFGTGSPAFAGKVGYKPAGISLYGGYGNMASMQQIGPAGTTGMGINGMPATGTGMYGWHGGAPAQGNNWYFGVMFQKNISDLIGKHTKIKPMNY
ncbi:MAG: hypothetical protein KC635_10580 [Myxococcales bacterium]|nr:hypothetical protein [Myxococcales bacterium]